MEKLFWTHRYFSYVNYHSGADTSFLPVPFCTLLYKVPLLSSEEDLSVPRRGREEIRLWPVVTSSPHWLCPRLWQKGIIRASASPAREITQRRESFFFFFSSKPIFPILWFSFWVSSTIRSVTDLKRTSVCCKSILQAAVINLKLVFMKLTFSHWGSDCILCGCHSSSNHVMLEPNCPWRLARPTSFFYWKIWDRKKQSDIPRVSDTPT